MPHVFITIIKRSFSVYINSPNFSEMLLDVMRELTANSIPCTVPKPLPIYFDDFYIKQGSISVRCVPPVCRLYAVVYTDPMYLRSEYPPPGHAHPPGPPSLDIPTPWTYPLPGYPAPRRDLVLGTRDSLPL